MNPQLARSLEKLAEPPSAKAPAPQKAAAGRWIGRVVWLVILAVACYLGWVYRQPIQDKVMSVLRGSAPAPTGRQGRGGGGPAAVTADKAHSGSIHVYLIAQGTVTAYYTVTLHTRVDGQIEKVYFTEGQFVHQNDPLVDIDPAPYQAQLDVAKGNLEKDQASLDNAKVDLKRYQDAYANGGAVPQQEVATQQALVHSDEGLIESDKSQIEAANVNLVYCHIVSPLTGRIGLRLVDPGNIVHAADTTGLAVITQLQPIAAIFNLPEDDLPQVLTTPNNGVGLPVDLYDRDDKTRLASGTVEALDNEVDPTNGTFKVKGKFANEDLSLFPNEFVNAHLLVNTLRNQTIVPSAAVQHGPDGSAFVYVVQQDQTVKINKVTEGQAEGDSEAVTGVNVGDVVVTDGTDKLQDKSKVAVTMAANAGAATRPSGRGRRNGSYGRSQTQAAPSTAPSPETAP